GGMRKRAALARALALDPPLLFLDEPTAGLDPIGAAAFDNLIRTLQQALGLTVFLITHDLDTLYAICDRVAVLADRKVVAVAPLDEIERTDHPWIQDYFQGPRGRAPHAAAAIAEDPCDGNPGQLRADRGVHQRGDPRPAAVRAVGGEVLLRPRLARIPRGVPRTGHRPHRRRQRALQRHRGGHGGRPAAGAQRPAPGDRPAAAA